uniref:ribonuclease III n=1 Tax=Schizosaccharomyces pombe TaxID=4896 RepID=Q152U6_SCHPM|nr:double-strand-specific Pac1 ribonuclease [Schizosaccharomyces pombe]
MGRFKRHHEGDSDSSSSASDSLSRGRRSLGHKRSSHIKNRQYYILEKKIRKLMFAMKALLEETKHSTKDDVNLVIPGSTWSHIEGVYEMLKSRHDRQNEPVIEEPSSHPKNQKNQENNEPTSEEFEEGEYPPPLPPLRSEKLKKHALMHISRAYEIYPNQSNPNELLDIHNERLEFLGDSFFNLFTTRIIFSKFPQMDEESLSKLRAKFVGNESADKFARLYGFDKTLVLSYSAEKDQLRKSQKVIADTFEAYLGALILDGQEETAFQWVSRLLQPKIANITVQRPIDKLAKSKLFHKYSTLGHIEYRWVDGAGGSAEGYVIACIFNGKEVARAWGANQKDAGSRAAMQALEVLAKDYSKFAR